MAAKKKVWRGRKVYARWLERRDREGWSLVELARRSRIPESTLQRWHRRLRAAASEPDFVEVVPAITSTAGVRAKMVAYILDGVSPVEDAPEVPKEYWEKLQETAERRITLSGYRLADCIIAAAKQIQAERSLAARAMEAVDN